MNQTDLNRFFKKPPLPKALPNDVLVKLAIKKAIANGSSFLKGLDYDLVVPRTRGVITYFGEQQLSFMANGEFLKSDIKNGQIYVPIKDQGYDVKFAEKVTNPDKTTFYRVHLIEVKTIFKGSIFDLSRQQKRIAGFLAIYNPRYQMQSYTYDGVKYEVPSRSYVIIKLQ